MQSRIAAVTAFVIIGSTPTWAHHTVARSYDVSHAVALTGIAAPFAAGFYRRLGARTVGWMPSPWPGDPGRRLPRMRLPLRLPLSPRLPLSSRRRARR